MDIAIIGLACRFPAAASPHEMWSLVRDAREADDFGIEGVADFDAGFFGVAPREAIAMDPRQRLALELTWELFEDAFVVPDDVRGQDVSVHLGAMNDDYSVLALQGAPGNVDHHSFAGGSRGMIANRVSHSFGLRGPSMVVDTGQSSSLVAVHLACEALRSQAAELAVAGGLHLNLSPENAVLEREFGALSATGHTFAFDARADGYVRSQGGGLVLLKPLHAALHDGNQVRAVIRGSAVGNAGHNPAGLTVPSVEGEAEVIRRALAGAGLDATMVDYVEAHGTGTKVGDPIEARALGEVFTGRQGRPVLLGSVKSNIGHTGAAAGVAGLLKAVLSIENARIPPSLNFSESRPDVDLASLGLRVSTALTPWPATGGPRRAGVSSFGMGGTNAHVVVEQAPPAAVDPEHPAEPGIVPVVLSARSPDGLAHQAARLQQWFGTRTDLNLADIAWSSVSTRSVFEHRAVVLGATRTAHVAGLGAVAAGASAPGVLTGRANSADKTVFVFPGQGSQRLGMGRQLYERFPFFAAAFDEVADELDAHLRLPLRQVAWGDDASLLDSTEFAQPALFAVEVALAALLGHWGVIPDLVMGHSVGEIAAARVAGVLSLADAAMLVAARGRLMAGLPSGGVMFAVAASVAEVAPILPDGVAIAAVNAADAVVISGPEAAVGVAVEQLVSQGRRVRGLAVSHAFHSALMEPMVDEFSAVLRGLGASVPRIPLVSNVTGDLAAAGYGSASYWIEHVRKPVRFAEGVVVAESLGGARFVEVGPGAGLTLSEPVLVADLPEVESLLAAVGRLFTAGANVNWGPIFGGVGPRRVELPTYAFQRQRFWLGTDAQPPVAADADTFEQRWQRLDPLQRRSELLELVRRHAAEVLGYPGSSDVGVDRAFGDQGFGSMAGVELRNRLKSETGLALTRTLIFDYPTPAVLADYLLGELSGDQHDESADEKIRAALMRIPIRELRRTGLLDKLMTLAEPEKVQVRSPDDEGDIDSLSPDALIAMALNPIDNDGIQ